MWFFGLIVVLLIGAVAVVASGRWGAMSTAYDDRPDMTVPARQALTSTDIESARFAVGVRGYRMDEVDTLLERVAKEVAERDRRIADLERAVAPIVEAPDGHGFSSRPYDPAEFEDTGTQPPILVGGPDPVARTGPADQSAESAESAGSTESAGSGASSSGVEEEDDEPETTELPRAVHAAAEEYERLQAEARAVLEAQSQPVISRRTPAPHQQPPAQHNQQQQSDPAPAEPPAEPPTAHWTSQPQQPLRLQQPQQPQQPPQASSQPQHWTSQPPEQTSDEPAAAPHTQAEQAPDERATATQEPHAQQQPQGEQQVQEQRAQEPEQAQGQQQVSGAPQGGVNGAAGDEGEEGWRFWPPADQQGEGAYQRPS
ncbi:DivIVA domain-containing protein [Kribbella sp. NBC_00482]|uniref:DivIVA domain-containing protein n=1 Tax=Kribbella sp. NBC_00482 TaxID=2975968 RepID=UPI002E17D311